MSPPQTDEELLNFTAQLRTAVVDLELDSWNRSDLFLLNWVKFGGYNVKKAEDGLRKALKWRQDENIDKVLDETFPPEFSTQLPYDLPGFDKEGWPILVSRFGSWDLQGLLNKGNKPEDLTRYLYRLAEGLEHQLKAAFFKKTSSPHDKPILHHGGVAIYDFSGITVGHFLSIQGIKVLTSFVRAAESYYPRYGYKYYVVNVTGVVPMFLKVFTTFFGGKTMSQIKVMGADKQEWVTEFAKYINLGNVPKDFFKKH